MGEADWVKVVEAACSVVTTYLAIQEYRERRHEYKEKVYGIMDSAIIKRAKNELTEIIDTLRKMNKPDIAVSLEKAETESEYGQIILRSYIEGQKLFGAVIDKSFDSLVFDD